MKTFDQLLFASYIHKQASTLGTVANFGSYMLPGVGTARYGYDAAKAFSQGRWLSGIGSTLGAGLSLIPGAGGVGAGLARGGVKLLAKGLGRAGAPTLQQGVRLAGRGVTRNLNRAGMAMNNVLGKSTLGTKVLNNPIKTQLGSAVGSEVGQGVMDAGAATRAAEAAQKRQAGGLLENMRRSPVIANPMYAGYNPNFGG